MEKPVKPTFNLPTQSVVPLGKKAPLKKTDWGANDFISSNNTTTAFGTRNGYISAYVNGQVVGGVLSHVQLYTDMYYSDLANTTEATAIAIIKY